MIIRLISMTTQNLVREMAESNVIPIMHCQSHHVCCTIEIGILLPILSSYPGTPCQTSEGTYVKVNPILSLCCDILFGHQTRCLKSLDPKHKTHTIFLVCQIEFKSRASIYFSAPNTTIIVILKGSINLGRIISQKLTLKIRSPKPYKNYNRNIWHKI